MKKKTLLSILILIAFTSCMKTKTNTKNTSTSSPLNGDTYYAGPGDGSDSGDTGGDTGGDVDGGYGDGEEDGVADGGQTQDYFTIGNISLHGTAGLNRFYPNGGPLWSSSAQLSSSDQGIFYTNSKFNVRVRAQDGPGQNTNDSRGNKCQYIANPYAKLTLDLCVRKSTGSCIYTQTFSEVPVGQVSKVKEFTIPTTSEPLVVEVLGVKWDYSCQDYVNRGYSASDPQLNGYCPMGLVWDTSCVKFDIQFSTDYTKDFPSSAPRY